MSLTTDSFTDWTSLPEPSSSAEPQLTPVDLAKPLKRKRTHLSSPPLSPAADDVKAQGQEQDLCKVEEQSTQTSIQEELQILETKVYFGWSGRGRPPFKTPATAALDSLRNSSRLLEHFEREIAQHQDDLDQLIAKKKRYLEYIQRDKLNVPALKMADILKNKPDLPPPSPKARSLSPEKYLARLSDCIPSVQHRSLNRAASGLPKPTSETLTRLQHELEYDCVPYQHKEEVMQSQPFTTLEHTTENAASIPGENAQALWKKAKQIADQAEICQREHRDENAWSMNVVRPVMEWETLGSTRARVAQGFSRVEYIQTQSIAKSCRQIFQGQPCERKKADFALSFSPQHPDVKKGYKELNFKDGGSPLLSQMNDVCTSKLILYLGAEVKKFGGNEAEAQGQLFTWLASGVTRLRKLLLKTGNDKTISEPTLPLLGWTIVGHKWELYACVGKGNREDNTIFVLGPLDGCTCNTRNYFGAFKLLRLIERIKYWGRETYWPWCMGRVIQPLALLGGDVKTLEDFEDEEEMSGVEDGDGEDDEDVAWD